MHRAIVRVICRASWRTSRWVASPGLAKLPLAHEVHSSFLSPVVGCRETLGPDHPISRGSITVPRRHSPEVCVRSQSDFNGIGCTSMLTASEHFRLSLFLQDVHRDSGASTTDSVMATQEVSVHQPRAQSWPKHCVKVVCTRPQCIFASSPLATRDRAGFELQERGLFRTELDDEVAKIATLTGLVVSEIDFFVSSTGNFNHFAT